MDKTKIRQLTDCLDDVIENKGVLALKDMVTQLDTQGILVRKLLKVVEENNIQRGIENKELVADLVKTIAKNKIDLPEEFFVQVKNFPKHDNKVEVTNFPKPSTKMEVTNFPKPTDKVEVSNFPKPSEEIFVKNPVNEVTVKNFPELKIPKTFKLERPEWWDALTIRELRNMRKEEREFNQKVGTVVNLERYREPNRPIAVRLSNGKNFYEAIMTAVSGGGAAFPFIGPTGQAKEALVDVNGHVQVDILSGGGGTEYTEDDIDSSITGGVIMWEDTGDTIRAVSGDKPLPIKQQTVGSVVNDANSSSDVLGIDGVFTGVGVDLEGYTSVTIFVAADVDSAANGMSFEFSVDNANWDKADVHTFDFSDSPARTFQFSVYARYFRTVYTNGDTGQGFFRLQTILHTGTPLTTIHRLDASLAPDRTVQVVKASLMAQQAGTGNFMPIHATAGGNLKVSLEEINGATQGQATMANSLPVVLSSNHSDIKVTLDGEEVTVNAANLDIRDMDKAQDDILIYANTVKDGSGTSYVPLVDGDGHLQVDVLGDLVVVGNIAHGSVDSGNPLKMGGRAQEPTSAPDEVADNDRVDALFDRAGRLATYQGYPRVYADINDAVSGNNTIIAAQGAGKKILITSVVIVSDGTVDVRFESTAGGAALTGQIPLQAREGFSANDPYGLFETAANALLNLELSAAVNVHGWVAGHVIDD